MEMWVSLFTGLDYWTGLLDSPKLHFKYRKRAKHAHSARYFANDGSLASQAVFPSISRGQSHMHIQSVSTIGLNP